jgi:hypothetical protein
VLYQNPNKKSVAPKVVEIEPEHMIHFKINDIAEIPFGFSIMQPMLTLAMSRLDINKVMPVAFKAYMKPYRHFKLSMVEGMSQDIYDTTINEMQDKLNSEVEPDSDIVTGDAWNVSSIGSMNVQSPQWLTQDIDEQMYACTGVPEYYFKPKGTTDLNINKADSFFRELMKNKIDRFTRQFMKHWVVPELDAVFKNSTDLPMLVFENKTEITEQRDNILKEYTAKIITLDEARKALGYEVGYVNEQDVRVAFKTAMNKNLKEAELYQDGLITDEELVKQVKRYNV